MEKLSQLLDISIGRTPSRSESRYWGKGHRWVSIRDLNSKVVTETREQITDQAVTDARCKMVMKGTLLFSFKLTIGKMAFAGCDLFTNEAIAAFVIKDEEELCPEFLYYALQSATYGGSNQAVMGKTLNSKSLAEIEIPVPPLDDQVRIAHLLRKVEGLIAQRKQHLQQLDDLLKSVFLEMFGDPVRNERGWTPTTIGQIIKVASGNGLIAKNMNAEGPHKVYGGNGVNGTHTEYMFDAPTLVIGRVGYYCGSVHITDPQSWVTDNALYVKEFLKKTDMVFLKHLLAIHDLNKVAGRAAQPLVSGSRIYPIRTIDVPLERQRAFSATVEKVEALKTAYQQSLTDFEALYGALSQQAFKGELDLSRVSLPAAFAEGESPVAAANPAPITTPVIELPETELLLPALGDRTQLAPLLRFWLEAYRTQLCSAVFSLERFIAAAQDRLAERHPDKDFELGANDYEHIKDWVFEALATGLITQVLDDKGNRIELRAASEQSRA